MVFSCTTQKQYHLFCIPKLWLSINCFCAKRTKERRKERNGAFGVLRSDSARKQKKKKTEEEVKEKEREQQSQNENKQEKKRPILQHRWVKKKRKKRNWKITKEKSEQN